MCFPDSQADMYLDIITTCAKEDEEEGVEEDTALKKGQRRRMVPSEFIVQSRISPLIDSHTQGRSPLHQIYPNQPHSSHLAFGYAEMKSVEPSSNTDSLLNSQHVISEWHVLLLYSVSYATTTQGIRRDFCCVITHPRYNLLIINRSYWIERGCMHAGTWTWNAY